MLGLALAFPAIAAEEKPGAAKPGTSMDLPYLMAPLTDGDGKLLGYAYIGARLTAASESALADVRARTPFLQDAFVRDVNNQPVAPASDPQAVDIPAIEARLKADALKVMGAGKVKALTVCTLQIAPLHPVPGAATIAPGSTDKSGKPPASRCVPA